MVTAAHTYFMKQINNTVKAHGGKWKPLSTVLVLFAQEVLKLRAQADGKKVTTEVIKTQ